MDKKDQRQRKTVQQIIDEREKIAPMSHAQRTYIDKRRKPPETARWHMRHKPYQRGGDADGDDTGKAAAVSGIDQGDAEHR